MWLSYEINPNKGDGWLYIENLETGTKDSIARGYGAAFHAGSQFLVFKIKPQFDTIRQLKIDEVKKDKWPKDSVAVYLFSDGSVYKTGEAQSFQLGEDGGDFVAILLKEDEPEEETEKEKKKREKKGLPLIAPKGGKLMIYWPGDAPRIEVSWVSDYKVSKNGEALVYTQNQKVDTIEQATVKWLTGDQIRTSPSDESIAYEVDGWVKGLTLSEDGKQLAFLATTDTNKIKTYDLYHMSGVLNNTGEYVGPIADASNTFPEGWCVSEHGSIYFSEDGSKLYFGYGRIPINYPKDTVPEDEQAVVDVWNWRDSRLQTHQLNTLEEDKKQSFICYFDIENPNVVMLGSENLESVQIVNDGDSDWALGGNDNPYERLMSWEWWYEDLYLIDVKTGKNTLVAEKTGFESDLHPSLPRVVYYNHLDSAWYMYDHSSGNTHNLTGEIKVAFYDELHDTPSDPSPYGLAGWTEDGGIIIQDRYDLWLFQVSDAGVTSVNITKGDGRRLLTRMNLLKLDDENPYAELENGLIHGFNETTKKESFIKLQYMNGKSIIDMVYEQDARMSAWYVMRSKDQSRLIFRQGTFEQYPELYTTKDFTKVKKLTNTNPQQANYLWGSVGMTSWTTPSGKEMDGLIYYPANFDTSKTYPMIVYFYERYSDDIHDHYTPNPSRSVINFPYYASNGYIVFIPDVAYEDGHPGQSAEDCIISGTVHMAKNSWVDAENMAIQGQSWGGYQVAYLVTQTDLYAAAMSGAPVSNMTSAYGGIRWGTGLSRMFQYERTQSRIGKTLWDEGGLELYIENSPLFFADQVTTPLLIMHNDDDGAVPWYQGIEYFVSLRRLRKPAWMLNYNGDAHNLMEWANRKDLTLRMSQFFGYYLKDEPAPKWMMEGVPALDKGIDYGFEYIDE